MNVIDPSQYEVNVYSGEAFYHKNFSFEEIEFE